MPRLDHLDSQHVRTTVERLEERIAARFPDRGIVAMAGRLRTLVDEVEGSATGISMKLRRARLLSRAAAAVVLVATAVAVVLALRDTLDDETLSWLPLIESTINDLVFAALALWFLYSLPERLQRGRSLALLHRLRSLAHVIDMHQLAKDPERIRGDYVPTPRSVVPDLDARQMEHYLEYCSEMLSLVGKAAALVAEESRDDVVLDAVGGIESLTVALSRKIWQKISLLSRAS